MKVLWLGAALSITGPAMGAPASETPAVLKAIGACRKIESPTERLRCFEQASAALDEAISENKLYALDKAQVEKTRRTLFGLPLPNLGLFDEANRDAATIKQIDAVLTSVVLAGDGNWTFVLDSGAVWRQTDEVEFARSPRGGDKVIVKRAALGSHMLTDGRMTVRVVRVR